MGKTYAQIQKEIASLQERADELKKQEVGEVIYKIKAAIGEYGLTASDLGLTGKPGGKTGRTPMARNARSAGQPAKSARKKTAVKYRDDLGNTWVGMGKRPQWIHDALAKGKTLEDFRV